MTALAQYFRHSDGVWPNVAALSFTLLGWPLGIALMTVDAWPLVAAGFLMTSIALIWSAYFIHEFAHYAIFRTPEANHRWGTLMTWLNGSCVARFDNLRKKHMRHHVERADVITFDVQAFLRRRSALFRHAVLALEWLYFPAVEFLMRGFVIARAWKRGGASRLRLVAILAVRISAFALLGWVSPLALGLYFLAYLVMVTVLRFADCFQHTYEAYPIDDDTPMPPELIRDKAYEQANTFSDVVGLDCFWGNLLWLNFGFHNAHHERPVVPWHRLPALHRELYGDDYAQVVTVGELLKAFHVHRVRRVLSPDYGEVLSPEQPRRADGFVGAVGVSFLTAV